MRKTWMNQAEGGGARGRIWGGGMIVAAVLAFGVLAHSASAITFDVGLDPDQEVPPPTLNGATPVGMATVEVNTITGEVAVDGSYSGTTSDVAAAHLHGLADPGVSTGVIFGFTVDGGTSGAFTGNSTLSDENLAGLLAGRTYLNVHTAENGPGEIRAQVVDSDIRVFNLDLSADHELPAPMLNGATPSGNATVVVDTSSGEVEVSGSYAGMTSDVTAAHLHGLAGLDETAGVIFGFDVTGGTSGSFSGMSVLSPENLAGLLAGETYLNVHTTMNPPGEIRAQVIPEPATWMLLLVGAVSLAAVRRFRSA